MAAMHPKGAGFPKGISPWVEIAGTYMLATEVFERSGGRGKASSGSSESEIQGVVGALPMP